MTNEFRITKNPLGPNECRVARMKDDGLAVLSSPSRETIYSVSTSPGHRPTGPRCRLRLLEKMHDAGIDTTPPSTPCTWCGAAFYRESPKK